MSALPPEAGISSEMYRPHCPHMPKRTGQKAEAHDVTYLKITGWRFALEYEISYAAYKVKMASSSIRLIGGASRQKAGIRVGI